MQLDALRANDEPWWVCMRVAGQHACAEETSACMPCCLIRRDWQAAMAGHHFDTLLAWQQSASYPRLYLRPGSDIRSDHAPCRQCRLTRTPVIYQLPYPCPLQGQPWDTDSLRGEQGDAVHL